MSSNFISEYLVRLGFSTDTLGYAKFASMLRDASSLVDNQYLKMAKSVIGFETAAIGAFAAIGAGTIGLADKVAMADQDYRLMALHWYTSLPVARELKIALDALGQPLENILWDPELGRRFHQLVEDQRALTKELGPDFENQMLRIRDVRFEFTRFGVELKYLSMMVVKDLAGAFGMSMDDVLKKLREFNEWLILNMPQIASWIASNLKPVLIDVKGILAATWQFVKQLVLDFTNLWGLLANRPDLMGATADFNKFGEAVRDVADDLAKLVIKILNIGTNIGLLFQAGIDVAAGNMKQAIIDLGKMQPIIGGGVPTPPAALAGAGTALATPTNIKAAIIAQARAMGVPPELALAVAQAESGYRQFDEQGRPLMSNVPGSHATGIFQLQPRTAALMGVDPTDVGGNILGGVKYLQTLLAQQGGDVKAALEKYYGSKSDVENLKYAQKVLSIEAGINIQSLTVHVAAGASPEQTRRAVADGISDAAKNRIQRNIAEFQLPGWAL